MARAVWSGNLGIWIDAQMSRIPVPASHRAATPKVSIGTVALRPHTARKAILCSAFANASSTGPQTNLRW